MPTPHKVRKDFLPPCFAILQTDASRGANRPRRRALFRRLHKKCVSPTKSATYTGSELTYLALIGHARAGKIFPGQSELLPVWRIGVLPAVGDTDLAHDHQVELITRFPAKVEGHRPVRV